MKYFDTHSHFNLPQFDIDREEAIARMEEHDTVTNCVGVDYETSAIAVELAETHASIWAIIGQHPTHWEEDFDARKFQGLFEKGKRIVAIGECGLDYYREKERGGKEVQEKLFRAHIELAIKMNLPLMLHIRPEQGTMNAYHRALEILREYKPTAGGTAHFFVGDKAIAQQFLDLGFYLSFAGPITFARDYDEVIKAVPLERMLSETDAPYAAPEPYRGKRAEPWQVQEVVKKIAAIKELPIETVESQLLTNAKLLFDIV